MRWHSKFISAIKPLLLIAALVTGSHADFDNKSIASRLSRYGDHAKQLNGIYFVDTQYYANIQAAITDAGSTGTVIIPSVYAGGDSYTNPNSITIIDLRGTTSTTKIKLASDSQIPTLVTAGKISGSALPVPGASALGAVFSHDCGAGNLVRAINTDGTVNCQADQTTPGGSGITNLNGLVASSQLFANGTSGTAPAFVSATSTHTLNIPFAHTASVTAGLVSKTEFDSFVVNNPGATQVITNTNTAAIPLAVIAAAAQGADILDVLENTQVSGLTVLSNGQPVLHGPAGIAPFSVLGNINVVTSLNADMVDGKHYTQINPMAATGAMIYSGDALGTPTALVPNSTTTSKVLIQVGNGTTSTAPAWGLLTGAMLPAVAARTDLGNTWTVGTQDMSGAAETRPDKIGTLAARSATCGLGATYHTTDTHVTYRCDPVNTWIVDGGGSGSGTLTSVTLPATDFTSSGTTAVSFSWGGSNSTAAPTASNTANAIMKRDATGAATMGDLIATSVTTNGLQDSAIDIGTQTPCVTGSATGVRLWSGTGNVFMVSEGGNTCVEVAKVTSSMGGDVNGAFNNATVVKIQGRNISNAAPSDLNALVWNAANQDWGPTANPAAPVASVFGRTGAVVAAIADYTAAQVTNAFSIATANTLTEVSAPAAPAAAHLAVYAKTGADQLCVKTSAGIETCFGAGGSSALSTITSPGSSTNVNMAGFDWALTQSANSTGDMLTLTGFDGNTGAGALLQITGGGATDPYVPLSLLGTNPAANLFKIKEAAAQTADALNIANSTGVEVAGVTPAGTVQSAIGFASTSLSNNIIFFGRDSSGTNLTGAVTFRGGDYNGNTAASNGENATLRGGDSQSSSGNAGLMQIRGGDLDNATSATGNAGDLTLRPGANSAGGAGLNGKLQITQTFIKGTTSNTGNLQCFSANMTASDCSTTSAVNFIGVAQSLIGVAENVLTSGRITVNLDTTYSATHGQVVCSSSSNAAKGTVANSCAAGRTVGVITTDTTTLATAEIVYAHF